MKKVHALGVAALLAIVGLAVALSPVVQSGTDTTRNLTATWLSDSSRHVSATYVRAEATTTNSNDYTIEVSIQDPNGGDPIVWSSITGQNGASGGNCFVENALYNYSTGTSFTVQAVFKRLNGVVNTTRTVTFVKP